MVTRRQGTGWRVWAAVLLALTGGCSAPRDHRWFGGPAGCGPTCGARATNLPPHAGSPYLPPTAVAPAPTTSGFAGPPALPPATGSWHPLPPGVPPPRVTDVRPQPAYFPPPRAGSPRLSPDSPAVKLMPPVEDDPVVAPINRSGNAADFPPDIPQFSIVQEKVASGSLPFRGGFEWLRNRGYRSVLHVRLPGEEDSAVRLEVENLGLHYLNLEVSPRTLSRETVQGFSSLVRDTRSQPLFVFDRKGMAVGSLWYLHFRTMDNLPDTQARNRALRLGLREETDGDAADWWVAINKVLRGL